jgi:hypothetical protein
MKAMVTMKVKKPLPPPLNLPTGMYKVMTRAIKQCRSVKKRFAMENASKPNKEAPNSK